MSKNLPDHMAVAAVFAPEDAATASTLVEGLRADGVPLADDESQPAKALLAFVSRASLSSEHFARTILTAQESGTAIVPVLLEPLDLSQDASVALAAALSADPVIAYDQPQDEKRRGILLALSALGLGGATAGGVADAANINTVGHVEPQAMASQSTSAAPVVKTSATAKTNAAVVKASSKLSNRTLAYGGAVVTTVLVVGALVLFQRNESQAPATAGNTASATTSTAPSTGSANPAGQPSAPRPTPTDIATGAARVTLAQDSYPVGVPIPVRVSGMPGHERDYVAIAAAGSPGTTEVRWEYLRGAKEAEITLKGVMSPGDYEVRLFFGNDTDRGKSDVIRYAIPLKITPGPSITLTPAAPSFVEGRPIRIDYDGLPGNPKDWLATAVADSADGSYIAYVYTQGAKAGTAVLPPLQKPGNYEIRVHFDDSTADRSVQARLPITVTAAPPVNIRLDAVSYAPGATITVLFDTMPGNQRDWFALSRVGEDGYLTYNYTDGETAGSTTFRAPEDAGVYEIRAYFDDTSNDRTVRATAIFTVNPAAP